MQEIDPLAVGYGSKELRLFKVISELCKLTSTSRRPQQKEVLPPHTLLLKRVYVVVKVLFTFFQFNIL